MLALCQESQYGFLCTLDWFMALVCVFSFTSKETRQNPATAPINVKIIHSFWVLRASKEIHTPTLGMKLTSVVFELEIKINLSKSKVKLHPYSKSRSATKCFISPLFKINIHHQMWNRTPTPNRYAPPARTLTRGLQHVNWVCRPLHHQSLILSS